MGSGYVPQICASHVVTRPFEEFPEADGYLVLQVGDVVLVEYVGCEGGEDGWLFGYRSGSNHHGWFPSSALKGDEDSEFARTATPDEDIFQRTWTPLAAGEAPPPQPPAALEGLPPPGLDVPPSAETLQCITEGLKVGQQLPMYAFRDELQQLVRAHRVVSVDAATGSGKSTLVPLCLAEQCLLEGRGARIVVTQPRRIAAKGLAQRVAQQVGREVGEIVGYRVGGHDKRDHAKVVVVYVTVGHFLEALVHDPKHLDSYSHVVLDEVHERFVEADFLMALLQLRLSRPETMHQRIVVMSATLQSHLHASFRAVMLPCPSSARLAHITSPGSTPYRVEEFFYEDLPQNLRDHDEKMGSLSPSALKGEKDQQRSDRLTTACKNLTKSGAKLVETLHEEGFKVFLVFLPGLDAIQEMRGHLQERMEQWKGKGKLFQEERDYDLILMCSALDYSEYSRALRNANPKQWKVVLATNMAESSLTVPNVSVVIDFGMHRINVYNDEKRMSQLLTAWCAKASLLQRRGRTGRTNDGRYYLMMPRRHHAELDDFDKSAVQRTALTQVALRAAYMAQLLQHPGRIRAGLPCLDCAGERHRVQFFDGAEGMWRLGPQRWAREEDLRLPELSLEDVLQLLPDPPDINRITRAVADLQDLGTLTAREKPTALGEACLKVPTEVAAARMVILGWAMNLGPSACVLAAALSLTPSCDVFRTPMKSNRDEVYHSQLRELKQTIEQRSRFDGGHMSEPLALHSLCLEWLRSGGGLGRAPQYVEELRGLIHERLWVQFTDKVVDVWRALERLVSQPLAGQLKDLQKLARGGQADDHQVLRPLRQLPQDLLALLTWSLAPGGFVAVGQSPSLYGKGSYGNFWKAVQESKWDPAHCLYWKQTKEDVRHLLQKLSGKLSNEPPLISKYLEDVKELEEEDVMRMDDETAEPSCVLHFEGWRDVTQLPERLLPEDLEFLYRLCSPFNGKPNMFHRKVKSSPQHPCAMNWYMPNRDESRLLEVSLNWKAPAFSLLNGKPLASARCRPKRFLVAAGGDFRRDYHGDVAQTVRMLRAISVLPSTGHGRQALLWLLAAGVPREAKMTALVAPSARLDPTDFEVRGLWMWERTFRMSNDAVITSDDLRVVNRFRDALANLQQYQPHRLAGKWWNQFHKPFRIDCLESDGELLYLWDLSDSSQAVDYFRRDGDAWRSFTGLALEESPEGLRWGEHRLRRGDLVILEQINEQRLQAFRSASEELLRVSSSEARQRGPWPARFVALEAASAISPFNMEVVEAQLKDFCQQLQGMPELEGFQSQDEEEDLEDDEPYVDKAMENVDKEYIWRLAKSESFDPSECRLIKLPEHSLALPTVATCSLCGLEGKNFSKRQLGRPIHERTCTDCCSRMQGGIYQQPEKTINQLNVLPPALVLAAQRPKECSICGQLLNDNNSTVTQRARPTAKRRCEACVQKPGKAFEGLVLDVTV